MCRDCRANVYSYTTPFDLSNLPVILRRPVFDDPEAPVHCDRAPRGLGPFASCGAGDSERHSWVANRSGKVTAACYMAVRCCTPPSRRFSSGAWSLTDGVDAFTIRPKRNPHWRLRADALHHTVDCALAVSIKGPLP